MPGVGDSDNRASYRWRTWLSDRSVQEQHCKG